MSSNEYYGLRSKFNGEYECLKGFGEGMHEVCVALVKCSLLVRVDLSLI